MKLKWKALLGVYVLILAGGLIQSCCEEEFAIKGQGNMRALFVNSNGGWSPHGDTIRSPFILSTGFQSEYVRQVSIGSVMSSAYAFSCGTIFLNELDSETLVLTVDKSFLLGNDTVPAFQNLLPVEGLEKEVTPEWGNVFVTFSKEFLDQAKFDHGIHTFKMTGTTTDGIDLQAELKVYLKL
jgi:hypothetical protein